MRVRGTVVTGMPRQVVSWLRQMNGERRAPFLSVGAVTSGGGGFPLISPSRYAAARALSNAPLPQAFTAAM
jgi:hypothetical protein